jgi:glycosyltransferase involved in cell wall biosynthesis
VNKIKILYLIPALGSGGTEKHLYQLMKYLDKDRFETYIVCLSDFNDSYVYDKYLKELGIKVYYFSMSNKINILKVISFIYRNKIDIIHSLSYSAIVYDMLFYFFSNVKKFITIRRNMQHHRGDISKLKWFEKIRNNFTSLILSNSYEAQNHALKLEGFDKSKIKTVYNGIELETNYNTKIIYGIKEKINYRDDDFIISNIANIKPVKRQEDLVKLISKLKNIDSKYKLVLIGREDNGYGKIVRNLIKEFDVEEQVFILPFIDDVQNLLNLSNIMIISSSAEGFSNAILEAYKCSVPVIATNVGGNKEIVNSEFLYEIGNINSLTNILNNLNEEDIKLEKINIDNKIKEFNLDRMINQYEDIYVWIVK